MMPFRQKAYKQATAGEEGIPSTTQIQQNNSKEEEESESAFLEEIKKQCARRNIPLESVKNARDLSSVRNSPIKPNRIIRTGRVSDATSKDLNLLFDEIGIRTLIDLRSPTELKDDPSLERDEVFADFANLIWSERKNGLVRELNNDEPRIPIKIKGRGSATSETNSDTDASEGTGENKRVLFRQVRNLVRRGGNSNPDIIIAAADLAAITSETDTDDEIIVEDQGEVLVSVEDEDGGEEENEQCCVQPNNNSNCRYVRQFAPGTIPETSSLRGTRKERHFVSLMNELKYVRGTLSKLRKRDIAKVLIKSPGAIVSRRVRASVKDVFLSEINQGGLPMLNELVLKMGAPGIKHVLELIADVNRHPIAFYCTAGKDRTGIISALVLSMLGVDEEDIVEDYSLSANVYAEMNDHKAMVGALSQRNINPKTFLGAPPQVMRDTLKALKMNYGSVESYLDSIGVDVDLREKLKNALLS